MKTKKAAKAAKRQPKSLKSVAKAKVKKSPNMRGMSLR